MQHGQVQYRLEWPKPGKALMGIIIANVVAYVAQLVLLRANVRAVELLYLRPGDVFDAGYVWQIFTYWWLHDPGHPSHLVFNLLWLWLFGTRLEQRWGGNRFLRGYAFFALGGSAMVLLLGLLSRTEAFAPLLPGYWVIPHIGASGAVMGILIGWGLTFAEEEFNFLLLGRMKGKHFILIVLAFELLVALSFAQTSSASHFGGMIAAAVLIKGLWRPSLWKQAARRQRLKSQRRRIEQQLRVLEGNGEGGESSSSGPTPIRPVKPPDPNDPSQWN